MRCAAWITALLLAAPMLATGCAELEHDQAAIVGGTADGSTDAVASVHWHDSFLCSAVLVGERVALTSAHCVYGYPEDGDGMALHLGADAAAPERVIDVVGFELHPEYTTLTSRDVAKLQLDEAHGEPTLPWRSEPVLDEDRGADLLLVGFGSTSAGSGDAGRRRQVSVPLDTVTDLQLTWLDPGRGICDGDSGGAAIADLGDGSQLVGLLMEGAASCDEWGAALRLDPFTDWLAGDVVPGDDDDSVPIDDDDSLALPPPPSQSGGCNTTGGRATGGAAWLACLLLLAATRRR